MARIDTLTDRLKRLRETRRRMTDPVAIRKLDSAIKRTEQQIANAATKLGKPPRKGITRTASGRFG